MTAAATVKEEEEKNAGGMVSAEDMQSIRADLGGSGLLTPQQRGDLDGYLLRRFLEGRKKKKK